MYLVNIPLTINWIIEATNTPPELTGLDIYITPPNGEVVYINAAIDAADYEAPTEDTHGTVSYAFTPDEVGVWAIVLSDGDEAENTIYLEYRLPIGINDTYTKKFVRGELL